MDRLTRTAWAMRQIIDIVTVAGDTSTNLEAYYAIVEVLKAYDLLPPPPNKG